MVHRLENAHWQAVLVPEHGGGIVTGRIRYNGLWVDVLRPTPPDKHNKPSSFVMLPWANRIRDGVLRYNGQTWQLETPSPTEAARHGDVRKRPWQVLESSETTLRIAIDSRDFDDFNFPFALTAEATYTLDGADFIWQVTLTNVDTQAFPAGFGFHPYWQHTAANMPLLQVPCAAEYKLTDQMADGGAVPISQRLDFRQPRAVTEDMQLDDLVTERTPGEPIRLIYEQWNKQIHMIADDIFAHVVLFTAPDGTLAVEPQTNANDGFNLHENGVAGSGVFVVEPQTSVSGTVRLRVV